MREIEDSQVHQLRDIPADLAKPVVSQVQSLQRMHPAIGTPYW